MKGGGINTTYPEPGVIYAVNVRRHPVRNRLIYDNLMLLDDEVTYIRTGTEETRDIKEIAFKDRVLRITIKDIREFSVQIYTDQISYDALKGLYDK